MELQEFLEENSELKLLKWVEIIAQENLAVKSDSMYIIPTDTTYCDVVFIDSNGGKRKIGGTSYEQVLEKFALLDGSNFTEEDIEAFKEKLNIQNGELSVLNFNVNDDMHLIMNLETNTDLNFEIDNNGHLILTN